MKHRIHRAVSLGALGAMLAAVVFVGVAGAAPGSTPGSTPEDTTDMSSQSSPPSTPGPDGTTTPAIAGPISAERCAENQAAGTITYLSAFDFAAAASIIDVVVAEENGYFDALCLDVKLVPSFATANYTIVAAGRAQFSSAGSYTEILNFTADGAEFVAVVDYGKLPVEALITPEHGATSLEQLEGATIGVKGDIPPSIVAMLSGAGLQRGRDYDEVLLDGFDPVAQLATGIDALPVYKSNEPGQLDAQGIGYHRFDPVDHDIPGTFGILYTSRDFAADHPTVVEDFTRAALRGMEEAIADPDGATGIAWNAIETAGNDNFLVLEGEQFRWRQEMALVLTGTPEGEPVGLIDGDLFRTEYDAYVAAGVWPDGPPEFGEYYDAAPAAAAYADDGSVIWDVH